MVDPLKNSVEHVIDRTRGRRGVAELAPIPPVEKRDDEPQLHLAAAVLEASKKA